MSSEEEYDPSRKQPKAGCTVCLGLCIGARHPTGGRFIGISKGAMATYRLGSPWLDFYGETSDVQVSAFVQLASPPRCEGAAGGALDGHPHVHM